MVILFNTKEKLVKCNASKKENTESESNLKTIVVQYAANKAHVVNME